MHVKGKMMAFCGLFLALSVVCMSLGSVIETNTLFLLAAASFFVGIVIREFGMKAGAAFLCSGRPAGIFDCSKQVLCLLFCGDGTLYRDNRGGMEISGAICQHSAPVPFLGG